MTGLVKETAFGEISKRGLYTIRVCLENHVEYLQSLDRRAKRIMENWGEPETAEELEDFMWSICVFYYAECAICAAQHLCRKKGMSYAEQK